MSEQGKAERLTPRKKPMRRRASSLKERPLIIEQPVKVESEHKDGCTVIKITPLCPPDCQCGGAHCEPCLTSPTEKD
jgi:hypothetical protein